MIIKSWLSPKLKFLCSLFVSSSAVAQQHKSVFVDAKGVLRWSDTKKEAAFFGVNYTTPFAYGYRAHKVLGVNLEEAIRQDVYHMARLGIDAFRVHVWDTEISDSVGNLLNNDHLRLFDFLISELKKRNIKTLITPIALWGNGYPEKDEKTPGFSAKYGKGPALEKEEAIKAQENYLKQFFTHVNPYTKLTYLQDEDVIATEINNEPQHKTTLNFTKNYINRLATAIRSTGWTKPVFYNINESPGAASAIVGADIDGITCQWYPTGLVGNQVLKGNPLPNVDHYYLPFDTIPAFKTKAKIVYEFDAADILQPIMYPAMARSFRTAGFQWATQFAYDPLATAYANTEYQTHYLNLIYTPAKAISLLIASKVFHQVPRLKAYGLYPASAEFETFKISYKEDLSEMNAPAEFYYTNNTTSQPVKVSKLKNIAGVGSSSIVTYKGTGAYFIDKIEEGVWRLEVMPDAIHIRDPFEKASLKKEVTRVEWRNQQMSIDLPDLGSGFDILAVNKDNNIHMNAKEKTFNIYPGTYLLRKASKASIAFKKDVNVGVIGLTEFIAPKSFLTDIFLKHSPFQEVSEAKSFKVKAIIVGLKDAAKVTLYINQLAGEYKTLQMKPVSAYEFEADIPAAFVKAGLLNYRIVIQDGDSYTAFPGNIKGDPWAWDNFSIDTWKTYVAATNSQLEIFNADKDQKLRNMPGWSENIKREYITSKNGNLLHYKVQETKRANEPLLGFQSFIGDKLSGRKSELDSFNSLIIIANSTVLNGSQLKISLINTDGQTFSALIDLPATFSEIEVPLNKLKADKSLLLPRPYPGFEPLTFSPLNHKSFVLSDVEKLEVLVGAGVASNTKSQGFEIESIHLKK